MPPAAWSTRCPGPSCSCNPGTGHLFADPSLPDHDEAAATLLTQRVLTFLATIDQ